MIEFGPHVGLSRGLSFACVQGHPDPGLSKAAPDLALEFLLEFEGGLSGPPGRGGRADGNPVFFLPPGAGSGLKRDWGGWGFGWESRRVLGLNDGLAGLKSGQDPRGGALAPMGAVFGKGLLYEEILAGEDMVGFGGSLFPEGLGMVDFREKKNHPSKSFPIFRVLAALGFEALYRKKRWSVPKKASQWERHLLRSAPKKAVLSVKF